MQSIFSMKEISSHNFTCFTTDRIYQYGPHICFSCNLGMIYQQILGIPMGTNCAPLISDLNLYYYERDFMSNQQKFKRFDLIDKFNDTSRYLDDIFTIDNPAIAEHIPDIYPRELQMNNANTSDKETSFLDSNIKGIGNDIYISVYDKRDDVGFPIVNFPWLNVDVPRLPSYGIYISQLVRFARYYTSVIYFQSKMFKLLQNYWHTVNRVTDITSFGKRLESSYIAWTSVQIWCNIVSKICI